MAERALLRKWSPKGGVQRFQAERNAAECDSWLSERCCANEALQGGVQRFQAQRNAAGALAEQKQAAQMEPGGRSAALSGRAVCS